MTLRRARIASGVGVGLLALCAALVGSAPARSAAEPVAQLTQIAALQQPIGAVSRPDDPLMYVIEKTGRLKTLSPSGSAQVILDLSQKVSTQNERGLLGVAFPPGDVSKMYTSYTDSAGTLTVSEFAFAGALIDPATERVLLRIPHPNDDHYGASLAFDADGMLYIGVGDGGGVGTKGGVGDRANNAQNLTVLLGKILRIDPVGSGELAYRIPPTNPFVKDSPLSPGAGKRRPEIFAYGLRNPWRISIDTGRLWITDVGQSSWEEINRIPLTQTGANFGWRLREGTHGYRGGGKPKGAVDPVFEYSHTDGRCAVIGGTVAGPAAGPGLEGAFVFGDLCTGRFMQLRQSGGTWAMKELGNRLPYLTSIGTGPDGGLIATSLNGGVYRLTL